MKVRIGSHSNVLWEDEMRRRWRHSFAVVRRLSVLTLFRGGTVNFIRGMVYISLERESVSQ